MDLIMQHVPKEDFRTYMFFTHGSTNDEDVQMKPNILQKFVMSKSAKNTMFRINWSKSVSIVEKQVNNYNCYDTKPPLEDRIPTFEGNSNQSHSESVISSQQIEEINQCVKQIADHLMNNSNIQLLGGKFYFKVDKSDNLVLIFCTNLKTDKLDHHTLDQTEVRLKTWFEFINPNLTKQRPQSNYQKQNSQKNARLRQSECPFCDTQIQGNTGDGYDITFSQILKVYSHFQNNADQLLELNNISREHFHFNQQIYVQVVNQIAAEKIPAPILKIFPKMTEDKYAIKKQDPLFLYESVKVCNDCYKSFKVLISAISAQSDGQLSTKHSLNKNIVFQQNLISQSDSMVSSESGVPPKPFISKQLMRKNHLSDIGLKKNKSSASKVIMSKAQTGKTKNLSMSNKTAQLTENSTSKVSDSQFMLQRQSSAKGSMTDRLNFFSERNNHLENESETESNHTKKNPKPNQPTAQMPPLPKKHPTSSMMMFSKVEAGKEVAQIVKTEDKIAIVQPNKNKDDSQFSKESDGTLIDISQSEINISKSDKCKENRRTVNNRPLTANQRLQDVRVSKEEKLFQINNQKQIPIPYILQQQTQIKEIVRKSLPKIDWEKEYQQQVKDKSKKIKHEIDQTLNQIENGNCKVPKALSDSLDLKIQKDEIALKSRAYIQKHAQSGIHAQPMMLIQHDYNSACSLQSAKLECLSEIEREYLIQQQVAQSIFQNEMQNKSFTHNRVSSSEDVKMGNAKIFKMNEQKPNKHIVSTYNVNKALSMGKRNRPMSSKPIVQGNSQKLNNDFEMEQNYQYQVQDQKPLRSDSKSKQNKIQNSSQKATKNQANLQKRVPPKSANKAVAPKASSGFLDFQNMTEDHIKQIADNADQLIQIIQNIKDKNTKPSKINRSDCIEEEESDQDCTYEIINTGRVTKKEDAIEDGGKSGSWWN